jgi:hypothetical protein
MTVGSRRYALINWGPAIITNGTLPLDTTVTTAEAKLHPPRKLQMLALKEYTAPLSINDGWIINCVERE